MHVPKSRHKGTFASMVPVVDSFTPTRPFKVFLRKFNGEQAYRSCSSNCEFSESVKKLGHLGLSLKVINKKQKTLVLKNLTSLKLFFGL